MPQSLPIFRRYSFLLASSIALVALADFFFYDHPIGWTLGAFFMALSLIATARNTSGARRRGMWIPAALLFALALSLVENLSPLKIAMTALMLAVYLLSLRVGWTSRVTSCLRRALNFFFLGAGQIAADLLAIYKLRSRQPRVAFKFGGVLRAWLVPVLLSFVFVMLFAAANPVISSWFNQLAEFLNNFLISWPKFLEAPRVIFWLLIFFVVWGILRARVRISGLAAEIFAPWEPPKLPASPDEQIRRKDYVELSDLDVYFTPQFIVRCLSLFNLVFLVQTSLDLVYLWGGRALPEGMSYASYAHRGAYPLVATALLAAAFVLMTFRPSAPKEGMATARKLVYLWLAQNVLLTFAAFWRLHLYVDVYTLTRLRIAAGLWMLLVAAGLVSIAWRIVTHRDNAWLTQVNAFNAFLLLFLCCFLNIDGFIAMYNVKHSNTVHEGGSRLDMEYLEELGADAIPALNWLAVNTPNSEFADRLTDLKQQEIRSLTKEMSDWRAWTFRRHRLTQAFSDPPKPGK